LPLSVRLLMAVASLRRVEVHSHWPAIPESGSCIIHGEHSASKNYALDTASGFGYFLIGIGLDAAF